MQSFRRSIRQSFRRRANTSAGPDDRKKIAASLNVEEGKKVKGHRGRTSTEPSSELSPAHQGGLQVRPDMAGFVTNLCFAETHSSGGGPHASVFASTMGSTLIRYSLSLPEPAERLAEINRAFVAGEGSCEGRVCWGKILFLDVMIHTSVSRGHCVNLMIFTKQLR